MFNTLDWIIVGFYCLAIISLATYVSRSKSGQERSAEDYFLAGRTLPWWAIGASLIAANISENNYLNDNPAIIFDKEVDLRSEPNLRSEEISTLHEGTKLNVIESVNDWSLIELKNGNKGWLTTSSFRLVK